MLQMQILIFLTATLTAMAVPQMASSTPQPVPENEDSYMLDTRSSNLLSNLGPIYQLDPFRTQYLRSIDSNAQLQMDPSASDPENGDSYMPETRSSNLFDPSDQLDPHRSQYLRNLKAIQGGIQPMPSLPTVAQPQSQGQQFQPSLDQQPPTNSKTVWEIQHMPNTNFILQKKPFPLPGEGAADDDLEGPVSKTGWHINGVNNYFIFADTEQIREIMTSVDKDQ